MLPVPCYDTLVASECRAKCYWSAFFRLCVAVEDAEAVTSAEQHARVHYAYFFFCLLMTFACVPLLQFVALARRTCCTLVLLYVVVELVVGQASMLAAYLFVHDNTRTMYSSLHRH